MWLHENLYEGSSDVINKFVELGKKVYLITNNSQTNREEMTAKCKKFGLNLELVSLKSFFVEDFDKKLLFLGKYDINVERDRTIPEVNWI